MPDFFGDIKKQLREANAERRAQNQRMRPARLVRLASGAVEDWTQVIKQAAGIVGAGNSGGNGAGKRCGRTVKLRRIWW